MNFRRPTSELALHQGTLEAAFKADPPRTINEVAERIEQMTGIRRSPAQVRHFLKGLGTR